MTDPLKLFIQRIHLISILVAALVPKFNLGTRSGDQTRTTIHHLGASTGIPIMGQMK
jgi:hypothetical protein